MTTINESGHEHVCVQMCVCHCVCWEGVWHSHTIVKKIVIGNNFETEMVGIMYTLLLS